MDSLTDRRIRALRAETAHRLAEIERLESESDPNALMQALEKAPSLPLREESDFGSDIY